MYDFYCIKPGNGAPYMDARTTREAFATVDLTNRKPGSKDKNKGAFNPTDRDKDVAFQIKTRALYRFDTDENGKRTKVKRYPNGSM